MRTLRPLPCDRIRAALAECRRVRTASRHGLTWFDVIVCLGIIAVLGSILLPATRNAKGTVKKLECLNNIRQVGIATMNYSSNWEGALPPLASKISFLKENLEQGSLAVGWPALLLPALDQTSKLKSIKKNAAHSAADANGRVTISSEDQTDITVFRCPADARFAQQRGTLSFVINFGFIPQQLFSGDPNGLHRLGAMSWNENDVFNEDEDLKISAATGVTWRPASAFTPSLDAIAGGDGLAQTIMLTENLQADTWHGTDTTGLGFGVPVATSRGRVVFGQGQLLESAANPLNAEFAGSELNEKRPREWLINAELKVAQGTRPRPSSAHAGGVNAILCDGSGRFLSEQIDSLVYIKLVTPNGMSYGEAKLDERSF
ncbi:DUF1559 family PulG-like putative transporter [Schlesneria paludicola]|uniref:DUF1559 family PulG-like putative transporter n=1 Tax=Schlesneria paludicola TaxID=360056 RepID=UPI00029B319D|nr:DUF1559 domain-containing protein [Schlesneria paludicola]